MQLSAFGSVTNNKVCFLEVAVLECTDGCVGLSDRCMDTYTWFSTWICVFDFVLQMWQINLLGENFPFVCLLK